MLEGGQNIYYGANGDLSSTAFNPLRDTVFMGNQEIYDNTKNVFAFTAGAMCPISKAYGELGKLSFRTVGTIVGQEIISDQAGNLANMAVTEIGEQWNWNPYFTQTLAMGTGIFASNKTSNTLVGLDQKFNFSGNYPKSFSAGMSPEDAARYEKYWTVSKSTCTKSELYRYLDNIDHSLSEEYLLTGKFPQDIQVPKSSSVLNSDGSINWSETPKGGYVLGVDGQPIKDIYMPVKGEVIDRYGNPEGRYTSPIVNGKPYSYSERSLPFVEDLNQYHKYKIVGKYNDLQSYIDNCTDLDLKADVEAYIDCYNVKLDIYKGKIASGFNSVGGGLQYQFTLPIFMLEDLGYIKEIK